MKKIIAALLFVGVALVPAMAGATKPDENGFHKVTICHNVSHNPHAISIDVAAVAGSQRTKHGFLVLDQNLNFVSFVPHQSGGHDQDFYLHNGAENKPEDDLACQPVVTTTTTTAPPTTTTTLPPTTTTTVPPTTTTTEPEHKILICHVPPGNHENAHVIEVDENGWNGHSNHELDFIVNDEDDACPLVTTTTQPPTTTTTEPPVVTTTTQPPVTTTTQPPVVTTTTQPPVTTTTVPAPPATVVTEPPVQHNCITSDGFPFTTNEPNCGAAPVESQPVPVTELPRTGTATTALAVIGALIGLTGLALLLLGALLKNKGSAEL